ncbi:MAG TPA: bifunctional diaminohydroxyphosphoribosylaminopyrimidine deaminase/5-amino-6-(5-phosphoribosylamino)uracil reductase RibD, partial [Gemmatimonadota bacterium]
PAGRDAAVGRVAPAVEEAGGARPDAPAGPAMARALELARRAGGRASPNPNVGAVLVEPGGRVLGEGFHLAPGRPHAEREALADAARRSADVRGAELVCTLEPCVHHGRTGPCVPAILEAGVGRVTIAVRDPNPRVSGRGVELQRAAGVEVVEGEGAAAAARLVEGFARWVTTGRPFVHLKIAMREDGTVHPGPGLPPGISSPEARRLVHAMRHAASAVLVGGATVRADDPRLTVREAAGAGLVPWQPRRVVLSAGFDVPPSARAVAPDPGGPPPLVIGAESAPAAASRRLEAAGVDTARVPRRGPGLDLAAALDLLGRRGVTLVLAEAGPALADALLAANLVDRLTVVVSPGGGGAASLRWTPPGGVPFRGAGLSGIWETRAGADRVLTGLVAAGSQSVGDGTAVAVATGPPPAIR